MTAPLITIGITCFNAEDTIERAIKSASAQDWGNTEIVIIDDVSTDNSFKILEKIKKTYPNLRIFQNEKNGGVAVSRNRIVEEAKGEFIVFFDDDDFSLPDRISRQYKRLIEYEKTLTDQKPVLCHTARTQNYPDEKSRYEGTMGMDKDATAPNGEAVAQRILTGKPVSGVFGSTATCSQMARTFVYRDLGGFDSKFRRSEDTDFNIRFALSGGHFVGISDPLVIQTMTLATDKSLNEERVHTLKLLDKHKEFINQKSSYAFCYEWINAKYDFLSGHKPVFLIKFTKLFLAHPIETTMRIFWAAPNITFNLNLSRFHNE